MSSAGTSAQWRHDPERPWRRGGGARGARRIDPLRGVRGDLRGGDGSRWRNPQGPHAVGSTQEPQGPLQRRLDGLPTTSRGCAPPATTSPVHREASSDAASVRLQPHSTLADRQVHEDVPGGAAASCHPAPPNRPPEPVLPGLGRVKPGGPVRRRRCPICHTPSAGRRSILLNTSNPAVIGDHQGSYGPLVLLAQ